MADQEPDEEGSTQQKYNNLYGEVGTQTGQQNINPFTGDFLYCMNLYGFFYIRR